MFEKLFSCPATVANYKTAPLAEDRHSYLVHCANRGYKQRTLRRIAQHQLSLVKRLDLQADDQVSLGQIEAAANQWAKLDQRRSTQSASAETVKNFIFHGTAWLKFVGRYQPPHKPCHAHVAEVDAYAQWMRDERGLSEPTVNNRCKVINWFFDWLSERDIALAATNLTDIDQFLIRYQISGQCTRRTISAYAQCIRIFFRFAEQRRWCQVGIADGIIPPRVFRDQHVPRGFSRAEVLALLATTEGDRPTDLRDRAILMLLITYGLRAGEVRTLQLDDLDWTQNTLKVRCSKVGHTSNFPLSRSVGESIIRYLREVRPQSSHRAVFLTLKAPLVPMGRTAVTAMVRQRAEMIGITRKYRGPHGLRHGTAQYLLDQGLSMKQIGDYLGHRSSAATSVYAKVDLNALREVGELSLEGLL